MRKIDCTRWLRLQRDPTVWQRQGDEYVMLQPIEMR
jgi:hypothetical protein